MIKQYKNIICKKEADLISIAYDVYFQLENYNDEDFDSCCLPDFLIKIYDSLFDLNQKNNYYFYFYRYDKINRVSMYKNISQLGIMNQKFDYENKFVINNEIIYYGVIKSSKYLKSGVQTKKIIIIPNNDELFDLNSITDYIESNKLDLFNINESRANIKKLCEYNSNISIVEEIFYGLPNGKTVINIFGQSVCNINTDKILSLIDNHE